jgi:hypothetical protein
MNEWNKTGLPNFLSGRLVFYILCWASYYKTTRFYVSYTKHNIKSLAKFARSKETFQEPFEKQEKWVWTRVGDWAALGPNLTPQPWTWKNHKALSPRGVGKLSPRLRNEPAS